MKMAVVDAIRCVRDFLNYFRSGPKMCAFIMWFWLEFNGGIYLPELTDREGISWLSFLQKR